MTVPMIITTYDELCPGCDQTDGALRAIRRAGELLA